jgi:DUF1365 family protein
MTLASALYCGVVDHTRLKPRNHRLRYKVFMVLIDLDELPQLKLRTLGIGRFNLFGFDPERFGDGSGRPLKIQIEALIGEAGLECGGPISVLAMPQILGRAFNPLAIYFCHRPDRSLSAILYEVNNTFGERHSYLIPAPNAALVRQRCDKAFYVSPFMDMDLSYAFRIMRPEAHVLVAVEANDAEGLVLAASFYGARRPLTDFALLMAWLAHPWMTIGIVAAIHLEAFKIWLKGERVRPRPGPPDRAVTVVAPRAKLAA